MFIHPVFIHSFVGLLLTVLLCDIRKTVWTWGGLLFVAVLGVLLSLAGDKLSWYYPLLTALLSTTVPFLATRLVNYRTPKRRLLPAVLYNAALFILFEALTVLALASLGLFTKGDIFIVK